MKGKDGKREVLKKKVKKVVTKGFAYIKSTYNNTIITLTDIDGNVISFSSPGSLGFTGSRKSTAFAATKAAEDAVEKASKTGIKEVSVIVKGAGMGRQAAVKGLKSSGIRITSLADHTPIPHGGCTPRKKPRK